MSTKMRKQLLSVLMSACMVVALLIMAALTTGTAQAAASEINVPVAIPQTVGAIYSATNSTTYKMSYLLGGDTTIAKMNISDSSTPGKNIYKFGSLKEFNPCSFGQANAATVGEGTTYEIDGSTYGVTSVDGLSSEFKTGVLNTTSFTQAELNASQFEFIPIEGYNNRFNIYVKSESGKDGYYLNVFSKASGSNGKYSYMYYLELGSSSGTVKTEWTLMEKYNAKPGEFYCYARANVYGKDDSDNLRYSDSVIFLTMGNHADNGNPVGLCAIPANIDADKNPLLSQNIAYAPSIRIYGNLDTLTAKSSSSTTVGYDAFRLVDDGETRNIVVKEGSGDVKLPDTISSDGMLSSWWTQKPITYCRGFEDYTDSNVYSSTDNTLVASVPTGVTKYGKGTTLAKSGYAGKSFYAEIKYALTFSADGLADGNQLEVRVGTNENAERYAAERYLTSGSGVAAGNWVCIAIPTANKTGYNYSLVEGSVEITDGNGAKIKKTASETSTDRNGRILEGYRESTLKSGATYIYFKMPDCPVKVTMSVNQEVAAVSNSVTAYAYFITEDSNKEDTYSDSLSAKGLSAFKLKVSTEQLASDGKSQTVIQPDYSYSCFDADDDKMTYTIESCKWYVKEGTDGSYKNITPVINYETDEDSSSHYAMTQGYLYLPTSNTNKVLYYKCEYTLKRNETNTISEKKEIVLTANVQANTEIPESRMIVTYEDPTKTYNGTNPNRDVSGAKCNVNSTIKIYAERKTIIYIYDNPVPEAGTFTNYNYEFTWYIQPTDGSIEPVKLNESPVKLEGSKLTNIDDDLIANYNCTIPDLGNSGTIEARIWCELKKINASNTENSILIQSVEDATLTVTKSAPVSILDYNPVLTAHLEQDNIYVDADNVTKWEYSRDGGNNWTDITLESEQTSYTSDNYRTKPFVKMISFSETKKVYKFTVTEAGQYKFRMTNIANSTNEVECDFTKLHTHVWGDATYYSALGHVKKCTVEGCEACTAGEAHDLDSYGHCTVCQAGLPAITTTKLSDGTIGEEYSQTLAATVIEGEWSLIDGELPEGLSLDGDTGTISGMPTEFDNASFTVKFVSSAGSDTQTLSIAIAKREPVVTAPTAAEGLTYNGNYRTLIKSGTTTGGTLKYRLESENVYNEELPVGKDAGEYTVYYKVVGDSEYKSTTETSFTVTIAPKAITVKPKNQSITVNGTLPTSYDLECIGLATGDTAEVVIANFATLKGTVDATVDGKTVGEYVITAPATVTLASAYAGNYTLTTQNGTLTVNARRSSGGGTSGGAVVAPSTDTSKDAGSDNVVNKAENKKTDTTASTTATITNTTTKTTTTTPATDGQKATTTTTITSTVDTTTADKIVEKAVENKSKEVVIDAQTSTSDISSSQGNAAAEVIIPTATIAQLSEKTSAKVIIKTDSASITLDKKAVAAITEQIKEASEASGTGAAGEAGDSEQSSGAASQGAAGTASGDTAAGAAAADTLKLTVTTVEQTKSSVKLDVKIETANGQIKSFNGGKVAVTVNLNSQLASKKKLVCVYINDQKLYSRMPGKKNANGTFTFTTTHFSTYAIMTEEEVDQIIAEQTAEAKELASKIKLSATSKKTSKGNIKVTLKLTKGSASLQKLEDLGYTVKYKFYRSTKKSSSYKAMTEKAGKTYTNTTGKKGTRYYYKARVLVYDSEGTLVAKSSLKQCKYASRIK